jgi:signal transduction histidine kinase
MLRAVVGLRTNTAVFLLLLLGPALLLAWLGFAAAVPLEQELLRNASAMTLRAATAFAAALPGRLEELLAEERMRLRDVAAALADGLPTEGAAAFARAEATIGGPLVVRRASGDELLPAPPRDLSLPFLDEWPAYRAFETDQLDPARRQQAYNAATTFVAPSLRARALAALPDMAQETFAAAVRDIDDDALAAAGPRVVERLLASENGRRRLVAAPAVLYAVSATETRRLAWFEAIGDEAAAARQRLRVAATDDEASRLGVGLPGGAEVRAVVDRHGLCRRLATTIETCTVWCEPAGAHTVDVATATGTRLERLTPLGLLLVHAEHKDLAKLLHDAARRQWLTGLGVLSLVCVMGLGVMLVRRAFRREAEARARRDQFLANVSHDLKTPLTSLRLHAEMLTDAQLDPATRRRYAAVVQAEGARMSALVEDLVDVSALQQGRRRIEAEPVDLAAAVQAQAAAWRPLLERDRIDLRVLATAPAEALADPTALGRILTNLLQNAVRHGRPARDGGPSWIELRAGPGPVLEVRDNGPGVPDELRERVFTRFERAAATGEGLGLGLALSRELAAACGGTLRCLDDGSTLFRLELPTVPDEELP